jgi:hypothetical protein
MFELISGNDLAQAIIVMAFTVAHASGTHGCGFCHGMAVALAVK